MYLTNKITNRLNVPRVGISLSRAGDDDECLTGCHRAMARPPLVVAFADVDGDVGVPTGVG